VYGVAADPSVPGAEERLRRAKGRDARKPIPLLAADAADVERFGGVFGRLGRRMARAFWPGAVTLVLPVRRRGGTARSDEGFRVPDHALCRRLLREVGGVLRVTSANRSGRPPALTAAAARRALGKAVDAVLDAGPAPGGVPSSVVRVEGGRIRLLREGAVPADRLREVAGIAGNA
jgi:L-threonylcarbamoyladenylate synthase